MDLFFNNCVPRERLPELYTVAEALEHIFSTSSFFGDLEVVLHGKTLAKINADGRGAATYQFKTVSGVAVLAEVFYAQARMRLAGSGCDFIGPPFSPASVVGFKANPEKLQVRFCK